MNDCILFFFLLPLSISAAAAGEKQKTAPVRRIVDRETKQALFFPAGRVVGGQLEGRKENSEKETMTHSRTTESRQAAGSSLTEAVEEQVSASGEGGISTNQEGNLIAEEEKNGKKRVIALFDLDGTLAPHRQPMEKGMYLLLKDLKENKGLAVAVVSGSDETKMREQLHVSDMFDLFDFVFCENGCVAYKAGKLLQRRSLAKELGEENLKKVINFALHYIADVDIPIKRGTFVEYRHGVLNLSPIGRNCSASERQDFAVLDEKEGIRKRMQQVMQAEFGKSLNLHFSLGGQISLDCFPQGWDKRLCLSFLGEYDEIHFFGDRTQPGGNDHEVFCDSRTVGHAVTGPTETMRLLRELFI